MPVSFMLKVAHSQKCDEREVNQSEYVHSFDLSFLAIAIYLNTNSLSNFRL